MKLTTKQQLRVDVISRYLRGDITSQDACIALEIKERQFRRLVRSFRTEGVSSVIHGNKGRSPTNRTNSSLEQKIITKYKDRYDGLNLVHFREKLLEEEEIISVPSYSTIRKILLREKLISPTIKRRKGIHKIRRRYEREGIMIQIDGSHHHWLPRHSPCCLTAAIDDATGKVLGATFTPTETTFAAMEAVGQIIKSKGIFQMLYSDRAGLYGNSKRIGYSNMERAMKELGVIPLQASTPQGKGRVERLFKTLQDRLCSEMRLRRIRNLKEANEFLKVFLPKFNQRFAVAPSCEEAAYKPLPIDKNLDEIFCMKDYRRVQNGHVISYGGEVLAIESDEFLLRKQVEIRHYQSGETKFFVGEKEIKATRIKNQKKAA